MFNYYGLLSIAHLVMRRQSGWEFQLLPLTFSLSADYAAKLVLEHQY